MAAFAAISAAAEEENEHRVVVNGQEAGEEFEEPGGYGQPQWAERSRASATTKLYVLSPFEVFIGALSESDILRHGGSVHDLTQEIEVGLPYRFELDFENHLGLAGSRVAETEASIGARYAFAAWGKIPLNPTLSAMYQFGTGDRVVDRFEQTRDRTQSGGYELRLLFGQEFVPRLQWAANLFFQNDLGSAHDRQIGFTQDIAYLVVADKLELGAEMRYTNATRRGENRDAAHEFVIGPSVNWKPNLHTVVSLAPLFGCTAESPRVSILASVSLEFGGGESKTRPMPISR
ncbi:MAG: hypothetical protein DLM73_01275 [Chthoniobacterales bacterium]|nr:MAG: hypothetical protein DLM73_01275 [Chthoniobacterales bacterium]